MKDQIPPNKTSKEAKHTARLLQRDRGRMVTICLGEVTRRNSQKAQIHKEKYKYVRDIARQ
jgi:hypothetical protein